MSAIRPAAPAPIQGNLIGLNAAGQVVNLVIGVGTGNGTGILVNNAPNAQIGGTSPADRNVISGNNQSGIQIFDVLSTGDLVRGNFIGTNLQGNGIPLPFEREDARPERRSPDQRGLRKHDRPGHRRRRQSHLRQ